MVLRPEFQVYAVIPVHMGSFQDGLELCLLVAHVHPLEILQEGLDSSPSPDSNKAGSSLSRKLHR